MLRLKEHIAILLLGIFVFPIAFHAAHLAVHSIDDHSSCSSSINIGKNESSDSIKYDHSEECAVCDYEFFINDIPQPQTFLTDVEAIASRHFNFVAQQYNTNVFATKAPRAPPAL